MRVTFFNKPQQREGNIRVVKVLPLGGDPEAVFGGQVFDLFLFELTVNSPLNEDVPTGDYTVSEFDPINVGTGYVNIGYALGSEICPPQPTQTEPVNVTVDASSSTQVCVYNIPAGEPSMSKTAAGYDVDTDTATWDITINNQGAPGIAVTVEDEGATIVSVTGDGGCGEESGVIPPRRHPLRESRPDATLVITVSRHFAQQCEPGEVSNTAVVTVFKSPNEELIGEQLPGQTTDTVDGARRFAAVRLDGHRDEAVRHGRRWDH